MKSFVDKDNVYAIVGATQNQDKWGYKVLMHLQQQGYQAVPINPKYEEIEGLACYPDIKTMPNKPDVVVTIVKPVVTEQIVRQCAEAGVSRIWMQPGSESGDAVFECEERGIEVVHNACLVGEGLGHDFNY